MDTIPLQAVSRKRFHKPPSSVNEKGRMRTVGVELEFGGLDLDTCATAVNKLFGGTIEVISTYFQEVSDTRWGTFRIELDSSLLKEKRYEDLLRSIGIDPDSLDKDLLENRLSTIFAAVVPCEVSSPPVPFDDFVELESLREELRLLGARGTRYSLRYAFGLHLNPEAASFDPLHLRNVVRAFILLQPWIMRRVDVDITRRISPYIADYPDKYKSLVLAGEYSPNLRQFINDYTKYNDTRNRALDMLPLLAYLDKEAVEETLRNDQKELGLISARPTFHFRLPNCLIDEPNWTIAHEWNTWVAIERLASQENIISEMSGLYEEAEKQSFKPFYNRWPQLLDSFLGP